MERKKRMEGKKKTRRETMKSLEHERGARDIERYREQGRASRAVSLRLTGPQRMETPPHPSEANVLRSRACRGIRGA